MSESSTNWVKNKKETPYLLHLQWLIIYDLLGIEFPNSGILLNFDQTNKGFTCYAILKNTISPSTSFFYIYDILCEDLLRIIQYLILYWKYENIVVIS